MSTVIAPPQPAEAATDEEGGGGRKKLVLVLLVAVLASCAGAWWFLLRPTGPEEPVPGEVVALEPIQINLSGGHYLRVGIALQLTETAHEVDGSKALDEVIALFSGAEPASLARAEHRQKLKHELEETLHESYHGDVMEVYFTEFVTQ